jgi:hypothetical protein
MPRDLVAGEFGDSSAATADLEKRVQIDEVNDTNVYDGAN